MKVRIPSILPVFLSSFTILSGAETTVAPRRGDAPAVNVERGPALDGTMAGATWDRSSPWPLGACTSEDPQKYPTWAKVLFDGTHVHVGVHCDEPDTDGLRMRVAERDGPVWEDDSVEVFLRPDPREPPCQFIVNPRGTLYDARGKDASWTSTAEARTSIERGRSWTAVLRIPMRELGASVGEDQSWTMNIYRTRPARGGDPVLQYSWSIMTDADYHAAGEFGVVYGVNVPRRDDGVTRAREGGAAKPLPPNRGAEAGGVTVYLRANFDGGPEGWEPANGGALRLVSGASGGKALEIACPRSWSGTALPVNVRDSRGLKLALLMRGRNLPAAGVNFHDAASGDNTTPYGHRYLEDGTWTPILYFLDRCRYNSRTEGFVSPGTRYDEIRFYGPEAVRPDVSFALDGIVFYRGADRTPPGKVTGLKARVEPDGVRLSWDRASDNVAPQVYVISRADGGAPFTKVAESHLVSYLDAGADPRGRASAAHGGTLGEHRYRVLAVDFEENIGPWSDPVTVGASGGYREIRRSREEEERPGYAEKIRRIHDRGEGKVRRGHAALFGDSLTGATVYPQCAEAASGTMTVDAFGYPSMTTRFGREKVAEILRDANPEYLFVLYGTNNGKSAEEIERAMEDLAQIAGACEEHGTVPVLGTIPPRGWSPESRPEADYNRSLVELCRKLRIPAGHIFEDFQSAGDRKMLLGEDGVHWRGEGMEVAGKAWGKTLRQIRFVLRDRD